MKQIFQSHWKLYRRYLAMANVLRYKDNKTDEERLPCANWMSKPMSIIERIVYSTMIAS